jgi:hypothetical protein
VRSRVGQVKSRVGLGQISIKSQAGPRQVLGRFGSVLSGFQSTPRGSQVGPVWFRVSPDQVLMGSQVDPRRAMASSRPEWVLVNSWACPVRSREGLGQVLAGSWASLGRVRQFENEMLKLEKMVYSFKKWKPFSEN